jgi:hypothetical protein
MEIFVAHDGEQFGPFSPQDVQAQIDSGKVSIADYAWTAGLDDWKPIHELLPQLTAVEPDKLVPVTRGNRIRLLRKPVFILTGLLVFFGGLCSSLVASRAKKFQDRSASFPPLPLRA